VQLPQLHTPVTIVHTAELMLGQFCKGSLIAWSMASTQFRQSWSDTVNCSRKQVCIDSSLSEHSSRVTGALLGLGLIVGVTSPEGDVTAVGRALVGLVPWEGSAAGDDVGTVVVDGIAVEADGDDADDGLDGAVGGPAKHVS
jgi:hypothetical protein